MLDLIIDVAVFDLPDPCNEDHSWKSHMYLKYNGMKETGSE